MLIQGEIILNYLKKYNINIQGVIHIGAHECEEKGFYNNILKIDDNSIIWIDGNKNKVEEMKRKGFSNIYEAVLDEKEQEVIFNITDNSQASSILSLNHEKGFYNNIQITNKINCNSETLTNFFKRIDKKVENYDFWNLDIQGSELFVLRGSKELLNNCKAIYTEVNSDYVYNNCGLISDLDNLLSSYGFVRLLTEWTEMKWGDALYLKI